MGFPEPEIGAVIRYAFLWSAEARSGREEGTKDRPAAIVLSKIQEKTGETQVWVVPVTHTPPDDPECAVEIPANVRALLGLDDDRQWLRADQLNRFIWPGYDLRPVPGKNGSIVYGMLPSGLYEYLRKRILDLHAKRKLAPTDRHDAPGKGRG